ncbi:tRNA uridine-5-carboxymethylaminomethyl(34) synthesis GTPase MnmE [bacterium]|nr:tRNA uridine-5-carboxymethylaminomethyl(34) synthesis GTPase MnmE [bacterium]
MNRLAPLNSTDTIAAISTPIGQGGLGIVRISGPKALDVADRIFLCKKGLPSSFPTHTVHYGQVHAGGGIIDRALVIIMRGPRTYTGEDTAEISCHGGRIVLHKTLTAAIKAGARPANPGEFTMRAFLNGKLDLSQAEAVQQLIGAQSDLAFRVASEQLRGKLHDTVEAIRSQIVDVAAVVEASIDFPEEDIEFSPTEELRAELTSAKEGIERLLATFEDGARIVEGVNVVIAGKPNVGKSTLLNSLVEKDAAIVTPLAGTTRDVLRESLILQGIILNVFDTAGIRKPQGLVEKEGVKRSKKALGKADLVLFVLDADAGLSEEDRRIFAEFRGKKCIIVVNKIDLVPEVDEAAFAGEFGNQSVVKTSALKLEGIEELKRRITENVWSADIPSLDHAIITSVRHRDALERAGQALHGAIKALEERLSPEFPAVEIREALDALGLITGETTDEEILDKIFSKFCIGK